MQLVPRSVHFLEALLAQVPAEQEVQSSAPESVKKSKIKAKRNLIRLSFKNRKTTDLTRKKSVKMKVTEKISF